MKKRMVFLTVGALTALVAGVALATQVIQRTPRELALESPLIVDGKVTGVRSYWNEDHSKIFTEATVAVGSTYKGSGGSTVRIVQPGGVEYDDPISLDDRDGCAAPRERAQRAGHHSR
jgi:hypothetical protein